MKSALPCTWKDLLRSDLSGWSAGEIIWLLTCSLTILWVSLCLNDTLMGIVSAISGVICVVCTGKGKLSAFFFGLINVVLYAIIAYRARFYGEVMLNVVYYLPMQFYGFYVWSHHINPETHEVEKRRMSLEARGVLTVAVIAITLAYAKLLQNLGGNLPLIDALSTVTSVFALIISIRMYMEQWMMWIIVDSVTIAMWSINYSPGGESVATLMMWIIYLLYGIIMHVRWSREVNATMPQPSSSAPKLS